MGHLITFWAWEIEEKFFYKKCRFFSGDRENMGCQKFRPPKSSMGSYFQHKIPPKRSFFEFGAVLGRWGGPQQQKSIWWHFGVMLLKNNNSCSCCQKLLIWAKPEKNRHHKWKLSVPGRAGQKFRRKFLPEGLGLICCQFVMLLKS